MFDRRVVRLEHPSFKVSSGVVHGFVVEEEKKLLRKAARGEEKAVCGFGIGLRTF